MNLFDVLPWWSWLVGGVGLLGAIAVIVVLLMAVPSLGAWIVARLGKRLAQLLVAIVKTPIGAAAIAGLVFYTLASVHTAHLAAEVCSEKIEAMKKAAKLAAETRDAAIAQSIDNQYGPIVAGLERESDALRSQIHDYEKQVAGAVRCPLGADALRLRRRSRQ